MKALSRVSPLTGNSRGSNTLCIGLLVLVVCLQLYLVSLWLQPASSLAVCAPDRTAAAASDKAVLQLTASSDNNLPDSAAALTALHLLAKYVKRSGVPSSGSLALPRGPAVSSSTPGATQAIHGAHAHSELETELAVEGIRVDHVKHDDHAKHADGHDHHSGDTHDDEFLAKRPGLYASIWLNISNAWADDIMHPERNVHIPKDEQARLAQCNAWQKLGNVIPDQSWGNLPVDLRAKFDQLHCSDVASMHQVATFIGQNRELYDRVWTVPEDRDRVKPEPGMEDKVIATIVAMTTRTITVRKLDDLALFHDLLPSFVKTLDPGFEYWIYLGYDKGDPWLDNADHLTMVRNWFAEHVTAAAKKRHGIDVKLVVSTWTNKFHLPGPAFNHVTGVAYADGATWIYRINDDTLFETTWAQKFVNALQAMGPPYGVVGPACGQGATHILVVDFVHRTHHEIFPTHYPPSLMSWWMDNWVTQVYGRKRTKRVSEAVITHLTSKHSTRYPVHGHAQYCRGEIVRGRAVFEEYLSHMPGMSAQLTEYRGDNFQFST